MCEALLIAPFHPDLEFVVPEAMSVVNSLRPRHILQGTVTENDVYNALVSMAPFDGVWVASHANAEGVLLQSGIVPHGVLAVAFAEAGVSWVVLNMCESDSAAHIYTRAGMDVIAVADPSGIEDVSAWRMGRMLAEALNDTDNLQEAYDRVREVDNRYRFFPATRSTRSATRQQQNSMGNLQAEIHFIRQTTDTLNFAVERLTRHMSTIINVLVGVVVIEVMIVLGGIVGIFLLLRDL